MFGRQQALEPRVGLPMLKSLALPLTNCMILDQSFNFYKTLRNNLWKWKIIIKNHIVGLIRLQGELTLCKVLKTMPHSLETGDKSQLLLG